MPQQMAQQIFSFVLDGTTYLLVNNNNDNNNTVVNASTLNALNYSTVVAAQASSNGGDLNPRVEEEVEESVDLLPLLDFTALTPPSLVEEKEKEEEKEEEKGGIPIPKTVLEMDQEEEEEENSLFQNEMDSAVSAACHPFTAEWSASAGPDLTSLLGRVSGAPDPMLLTPSPPPDLLLHTPTTPTTASTSPLQLFPTATLPTTTTNTFSGDFDRSLVPGTSFPFMSASWDDCHGSINSVLGTLAHTPASASPSQILSPSPNMNRTASSSSSSSSSADDVSSFSSSFSSSSGDLSTPGFDEVMSFSDVLLAGIHHSPNNSPHDDVIMPVEANTPTLQLADVTVPRHEEEEEEETSTSWNDEGTVIAAAAPEVRVVTSGNGAQCLLLLPATDTDKMAAEEEEKMAAEEEEKMAAEAVEVLETCSLTPLVKEELKYTIQSRRLAAGKAELASPDVSCTRIFRHCRRGGGSRGGQKSLTAEERERDGKRREQNRQAAQRFRQKQRDTETVLSKKCRKLEGSNSCLREEILRLAREVQQLQHAMDTHLPSCSQAPQQVTQ